MEDLPTPPSDRPSDSGPSARGLHTSRSPVRPLEAFAPTVHDLPRLILFYLLGRAFSDGARSLTQAAAAVEASQAAGRVAATVSCSRAHCSRVLTRLGNELFGPRYGQSLLSLLEYEYGSSARLSDGGERALAETKDHLERIGLLPKW